MNAPLVKYEMVMQRCPNPQAISICIGTVQAREWVKLNKCYMDAHSFMSIHGFGDKERELPIDVTIIVPVCYDFEEVFTFMSNKPFCHVGDQIQMRPDSNAGYIIAI